MSSIDESFPAILVHQCTDNLAVLFIRLIKSLFHTTVPGPLCWGSALARLPPSLKSEMKVIKIASISSRNLRLLTRNASPPMPEWKPKTAPTNVGDSFAAE